MSVSTLMNSMIFSLEWLADAKEVPGTVVYLRLDATRLSEPSYLGAADARINFDGYGLASSIALSLIHI